jgi:ATP citrate (pro-S)-lyase
MSAKAIREYHGKKLASRWLSKYACDIKYDLEDRALLITPSSLRPEDPTAFDILAQENPWVLTTPLVVKPDQLIKRRGKAGLLAINKTWAEVVEWIKERMNKECKVEVVTGMLDHFIVEPFVPHAQSDEYYICLQVMERESGVLDYESTSSNVTCCVQCKPFSLITIYSKTSLP